MNRNEFIAFVEFGYHLYQAGRDFMFDIEVDGNNYMLHIRRTGQDDSIFQTDNVNEADAFLRGYCYKRDESGDTDD